jgi:hypothetical protein
MEDAGTGCKGARLDALKVSSVCVLGWGVLMAVLDGVFVWCGIVCVLFCWCREALGCEENRKQATNAADVDVRQLLAGLVTPPDNVSLSATRPPCCR